MKSRKMKWAMLVARMNESTGIYRGWWGKPREIGHLGSPGIDGRIILR
jgi:hypothetical protein